uniref:Uncharacterized protein n=1 Tax=Meloidogyne enterolobii TaxID=390850 RepID=A0A6V7UF08_MELEN|nr:unnamed protein product [Meloidogyne enterolobii]
MNVIPFVLLNFPNISNKIQFFFLIKVIGTNWMKIKYFFANLQKYSQFSLDN